jgi:hypothetical protein
VFIFIMISSGDRTLLSFFFILMSVPCIFILFLLQTIKAQIVYKEKNVVIYICALAGCNTNKTVQCVKKFYEVSLLCSKSPTWTQSWASSIQFTFLHTARLISCISGICTSELTNNPVPQSIQTKILFTFLLF